MFHSNIPGPYYDVFGWYSWEACSFLMENGGVVDLVEMENMCWELRGTEGGEVGVGM